jgi:hypothetical protein
VDKVIGDYLVSLKGISGIPITVTVFIPKIPGRYFGEPEKCFPEEPLEMEWDVNTGNTLLDTLIKEDYVKEVEKQLFNLFKEREKEHE